MSGKCTLTLYQASLCAAVFVFTPLWLFLHHKFRTQDAWWQCWNIWSQCPAALLTISKNNIWWVDFIFNVKSHSVVIYWIRSLLLVVKDMLMTSGINVANLTNSIPVHVNWNTRLLLGGCVWNTFRYVSKGLSFVGACITGRNGVTSVYMLKETTMRDITHWRSKYPHVLCYCVLGFKSTLKYFNQLHIFWTLYKHHAATGCCYFHYCNSS